MPLIDKHIAQDAHEAEIQSLSFSFPGLKDVDSENASSSDFLLASGGKGRTIHIYDVKRCKNNSLLRSFGFPGKAIRTYMIILSGTLIPLGVFVVQLL